LALLGVYRTLFPSTRKQRSWGSGHEYGGVIRKAWNFDVPGENGRSNGRSTSSQHVIGCGESSEKGKLAY
jgi:hypothetical protein